MGKISKRDLDQEERKRFKKYNIYFRGPAYEWPTDHARAFQHVSVLGSQKLSAYYPDASMRSLEPGERLWKSRIKDSARRLVEMAERNVGNFQSEMKWRLDLEQIRLVNKRFELEIEWQVVYSPTKYLVLTAT